MDGSTIFFHANGGSHQQLLIPTVDIDGLRFTGLAFGVLPGVPGYSHLQEGVRMLRAFLAVSLALFLLTLTSCGPGGKSLRGESRMPAELGLTIVADTHNDVLLRAVEGEDLGTRTKRGHSDLPRFREGGITFQGFSVWVNPTYGPMAFERASAIIDSFDVLVRRYPHQIGLARRASDVESLVGAGKLAGFLALEGGIALGTDLSRIDSFYNRGVRSITLTWNDTTPWASSAEDEAEHPKKLAQKGLTELGRAAVQKMNELGVLIDVSHPGERTFWDIVEITKKPIIASHSGVYELCNSYRNLKDGQIRAIAKSRGIVCIAFYPGYLDSTFTPKFEAMAKRHKSELDSLREVFKGHDDEYIVSRNKLLKDELDTIRTPLSRIVDHIEYVVKLVGADCVGIGSDFDGMGTTPLGLDDVTGMPKLVRELMKRGFTPGDIRKIMGENFLRVFREVSG